MIYCVWGRRFAIELQLWPINPPIGLIQLFAGKLVTNLNEPLHQRRMAQMIGPSFDSVSRDCHNKRAFANILFYDRLSHVYPFVLSNFLSISCFVRRLKAVS